MKKHKRILLIVMVLLLVFSVGAFAAQPDFSETKGAGQPTLTVFGNTAKCKAIIKFSGQPIEATLELWQGSTLVGSWSNSGTGSVTVSGNATIVHGLTYTLTVSGTVNGVPFTPQSITRTL